ncbi:MAG: hypothetical protein ACOWWO_15205 [Peptococcaceae bacterium]
MEKKKRKTQKKPVVAPGDDAYLKKDASPEDIAKGNFTMVTSLSYDEVDVAKEE